MVRTLLIKTSNFECIFEYKTNTKTKNKYTNIKTYLKIVKRFIVFLDMFLGLGPAVRGGGMRQLNGSHVMGSCTHLSFVLFNPNGSHVMGSCTPPYERPNMFASDMFMIRFDDGLATRPRC